MLVNSDQLEGERRNETFMNLFGVPNNLTNKFENIANKERQIRKSNMFKQNRLNRTSNKDMHQQEKNKSEAKSEGYDKSDLMICCSVCKTMINLDEYYKKLNPFKPLEISTESFVGHKRRIN